MSKKYLKKLFKQAYSVLTVFMLLSTNFSPLIYNFSTSAIAQESIVQPVDEEAVTQEAITPDSTNIPTQVEPIQAEKPVQVVKEEEVVEEVGKPVLESKVEETPQEDKDSGVVVVDAGDGKLSSIVNSTIYNCLPTTSVGCVVTDKKDYSPTDTVKITGYGYLANEKYIVIVYSDNDPKVRVEINVTTNSDGKFYTEYTLDGNYRPFYSIEVKDINDATVGTHTFTDSRTINSVKVNGGSTTSVLPSGTISLAVTVITSGNNNQDNWKSTRYQVEGQTAVCDNHNDHNSSGTNTEIFNLTAPNTIGSYDVTATAYDDNGCSSGASSPYTLLNAIVVENPAKPDLTVTKTNNVSGQTTKNTEFTWTLKVVNEGTSSATFNNQDILKDDFPSSNISYDDTSNIPVTVGGGTTGSVDCDISTNTLICDDDNGGSAVIIPVGGWFSVDIKTTFSQNGTYANPRNDGVCKVDPDSLISELDENNNTCSDTVTVATNTTPNPSLSQSCGIDVGLVIDTSTSIDSTELGQMKTAMKSFVSAFTGTSTQMSIVSFDDSAVVRSNFTSNLSSLNTVIDGISGSGYTNWEDALLKIRTLFPNRNDKPDLIVFTSDGNPTASSAGANNLSQPNVHLNPAIIQADQAKTAGIRIITLGIGNDLSANNLIAISSADAYYNSSNFSTLATTLSQLVSDLCGGTITVKKVVTGQDGASLSGWTFSVDGNTYQTDSEGFTQSIDVNNGTYSVVESVKNGYTLTDAVCYKNQILVGSSITNGVGNISVTDDDVISCTFTNAYVPVCGDSQVSGGEQCDLGSSNGNTCTPTYGGSCQYCSNTCQYETVQGGYCGDAIKNGPEECDGTDGLYNSSYQCTKQCSIELVEEKVQICHATHSDSNPIESNPYVSNEPNKSGDLSGHDDHDGDVWYPGIDSKWGDIIPPFDYLDGSSFAHYDGKNWTTEGRAIWNNGCDIEKGKIRVEKTTNPSKDQMNFDITLSTSDGYVFGSADGVVSDSDDYTYEVVPGTYTVTEDTYDSYSTEYNNCRDIKVVAGETSVCEIINTLKPVNLKVVKEVINDNGGTKGVSDFEIRLNGELLSFDLGVYTESEMKTTYSSENEIPANVEYTLSERTDFTDYTAGTWSCIDDTSEKTITLPAILEPDQKVTCTIVNDDNPGKIVVNKEFDNSIDGIDSYYRDNDLAESLNLKWKLGDNPTEYSIWGQEIELSSGQYSIEELKHDGYEYPSLYVEGASASCNDMYRKPEEINGDRFINVENGQTTYITFCNKLSEPLLEIFKFNNAVGDKFVGDTVEYTIQVKVTGGKVNGLLVRDSLPSGFDFVPGNSSVKVNNNPSAYTEPTYSGFADWELSSLGILNPDDVVTITYLAQISSIVDKGLYKDIAWAKAKAGYNLYIPDIELNSFSVRSISLINNYNTIYALATGVGSLGGNFVGTEVNVNEKNIVQQGVVLGASTVQLPNTGSNPLLVLVSIISILLGVGLIAFGFKNDKNKKGISVLAVLFMSVAILLSATSNIFAAPSTTLRVEEPATSVNGEFNVDYVVLDLNNNAVEIKCKITKPDLSIVEFSTQNTNPGGGAGKCEITNTLLDKGDGEYKVTVTANGALEETVSTNLMTSNPETPVTYTKTASGVCKNTISFKTAADLGKTVKVEIFRSTSTSFTADATTYAGSVTIASDTEGSFEDTKPNCSKTYYYAVRAVDSAGNTSDFVGDTIVVTLPGQVINAANQNNTNQATVDNGQVQGETDNTQNQENNNGEVKGETDQDTQTDTNKEEDGSSTDKNDTVMKVTWKDVLVWGLGISLTLVIIWQLFKLGVFQNIFQAIWKLITRK